MVQKALLLVGKAPKDRAREFRGQRPSLPREAWLLEEVAFEPGPEKWVERAQGIPMGRIHNSVRRRKAGKCIGGGGCRKR